ncbi:MAG TPA: response regulator [Nitrososphaera sp.]|jgi:DNA-binding response OmpR family regulator|nr:response regulator [Nitrososphaera sp.]HEX2615499.1 response regulator [Nitrososphaera sp.]
MAQVLLIETDHLLGKNLSGYLKKSGHKVNWQVDPQSAIDKADDERPDVIILDLVLASRSGIEFLYEFRSYPDWQDLPVIFYSNISADEVQDCLDAFEQLNVAAYHYKPTTSMAKLAHSLDEAVKLIPA